MNSEDAVARDFFAQRDEMPKRLLASPLKERPP